RGRPTIFGRNGVVKIASTRRSGAPGESTSPVTNPKEPSHLFGRSVGVDAQHQPAHRVCQYPYQCWGLSSQPASLVEPDRTGTGESGRLVASAQEGQRGDHDSDLCVDCPCQGMGRTIGGGRFAGQEQFGGQVGTELVEG